MTKSTSDKNRESRWFGYNEVDPAEKTRRVIGVFDSVADRYDIMNDLMSAGIHRLWKNRFVRLMRPAAHKKLQIRTGRAYTGAPQEAERSPVWAQCARKPRRQAGDRQGA